MFMIKLGAWRQTETQSLETDKNLGAWRQTGTQSLETDLDGTCRNLGAWRQTKILAFGHRLGWSF